MKKKISFVMLSVCVVVSILTVAYGPIWPIALALWAVFMAFYTSSLPKKYQHPESYKELPLSLVLGEYFIYTNADIYSRHGNWVNFSNGANVSITNGFRVTGNDLYVLDGQGKQVHPKLR